MYLWNVESLAEDLRLNSLSEYEKLKYYILVLVLMNIQISSMNSDYKSAWPDDLSHILNLLFVVFSTYHFYKINSKGDSKAFIERHLCLSVALLFRSILVLLIAAIFLTALKAFLESSLINLKIAHAGSFIFLVASIVQWLYYIKWMNQWMKYVSRNSATTI